MPKKEKIKIVDLFEEDETDVLNRKMNVLANQFSVHSHNGRDSVIIASAPISKPKVIVLADEASIALDAKSGDIYDLTATGNRAISAPTNPPYDGAEILIRHTASGSNRTLSLASGAGGFRFGTSIASLSATTSGLIDYIGCIYNLGDEKWDIVSYVKGF